MGLLTLTQLCSEVQANLRNRTDLTNSRVATAINLAQSEISTAWDFRELQQFYNVETQFTDNPFNDKFVPLAPFTKHLHSAVLKYGTSSWKLQVKPWQEFDRRWPAPESFGRSIPSVATQWGQTMIIYPICNQVYTIASLISTIPRPFSYDLAPAAVSDYEEDKDQLLIKLASAYLWGSFGRTDASARLRAECLGVDFPRRIGGLLGGCIQRDKDRPGMDVSADLTAGTGGNYWLNPWIGSTPG